MVVGIPADANGLVSFRSAGHLLDVVFGLVSYDDLSPLAWPMARPPGQTLRKSPYKALFNGAGAYRRLGPLRFVLSRISHRTSRKNVVYVKDLLGATRLRNPLVPVSNESLLISLQRFLCAARFGTTNGTFGNRLSESTLVSTIASYVLF